MLDQDEEVRTADCPYCNAETEFVPVGPVIVKVEVECCACGRLFLYDLYAEESES